MTSNNKIDSEIETEIETEIQDSFMCENGNNNLKQKKENVMNQKFKKTSNKENIKEKPYSFKTIVTYVLIPAGMFLSNVFGCTKPEKEKEVDKCTELRANVSKYEADSVMLVNNIRNTVEELTPTVLNNISGYWSMFDNDGPCGTIGDSIVRHNYVIDNLRGMYGNPLPIFNAEISMLYDLNAKFLTNRGNLAAAIKAYKNGPCK
jgi:hypothetical protein